MSAAYAIAGRGGLFSIVREILGDEGFLGFYDDQPADDPRYLGPVADLRVAAGATVFVAIGALRHMRLREQLLMKLASARGLASSAISDRAYKAPSVELGGGSVLCPFACLHSNVRAGRGCVFFSGTVIEHDCVIGNNANVGPGVTVAGSVTIGDNVFVGAGSTIKDGIAIGSNSVIGAGSVVLRDVPPGAIAYGSPARVARQNDLYQAV